MSSFKVFEIAGSGLSAQSVRLNTVASNLANADSVSGDPNTVYKARHPVFQAVHAALGAQSAASQQRSGAAVRVSGIVESNAPPTVRNDPGNPLADAQGNVYAPNVNVIEEMTDMISASRAYQNDVEVMSTAKDLMLATLKLGG
ncbi:MAG TPA: flagellar basal body rod protein FlgC [Steroidobacteraceae bacterium]|nr:flagellar basal body rod protein FlgC [Gammaproteobacteria bacterium]HEV2286313.1 flagellar basal body rod protein FlgC [Steroidobacteraceae bacterium]